MPIIKYGERYQSAVEGRRKNHRREIGLISAPSTIKKADEKAKRLGVPTIGRPRLNHIFQGLDRKVALPIPGQGVPKRGAKLSSKGVVATTGKQKKKLIDDAIAAMGRKKRSKSSGKLAGADRSRRGVQSKRGQAKPMSRAK